MTSNRTLALGSILMFLGVAAGAFGAHGLRDSLTPESMAIYQTAVQYQVIHALALVALGFQERIRSSVVGLLFTIGIAVFSGSLYALAITDIKWLGAITPIGGLCFLSGWATLAWISFSRRPQE